LNVQKPSGGNAWGLFCVLLGAGDLLKFQATKHQTQHQRMIRRLLDSYVDAHSGGGTAARRVRAASATTKVAGS